MAKVIRGTRDAQGNVILKGGAGGIRKVRCPTCGGFAQPAQVNGKDGYACGACRTQFISQRM